MNPFVSASLRRGHGARSARQLALALLFSVGLLGWLAGCGAGLGGTGTGDNRADLGAFGATSAPLCASTVGAALGCAGPASPGSGLVAITYLSDSTGTRRARLDGNTIELQLLCAGQQFNGEWGVVSGQAPRFYGSLSTNGVPSLATLTAEAQTDGSLDLRLFDTGGRLLVGPLRMRGSAPPAGVVICP